MLDNIESASQSHFKRQVNPTAEGHLRPESRQGHESHQANRAQDRFDRRAELQKSADTRLERQLEASETSRRRSEALKSDAHAGPSRAAEMAEKLARSIKQARQEEAREQRFHRFSPANRSRQISQTYEANLPIQTNRLVDEMV